MGLNSNSAASIFQEIIQHRKFPGALFIADDQWKETLREAMGLRRDG